MKKQLTYLFLLIVGVLNGQTSYELATLDLNPIDERLGQIYSRETISTEHGLFFHYDHAGGSQERSLMLFTGDSIIAVDYSTYDRVLSLVGELEDKILYRVKTDYSSSGDRFRYVRLNPATLEFEDIIDVTTPYNQPDHYLFADGVIYLHQNGNALYALSASGEPDLIVENTSGAELLFTDDNRLVYRNGGDVFVFDGIGSEPELVLEIDLNEAFEYQIKNDTIYYISNDLLYRSNLSFANPVLLTAPDNYPVNERPRELKHMVIDENGHLVFIAENDLYGNEVWVSDGSPENTNMLTNLGAGSWDGVYTQNDGTVAKGDGVLIFKGGPTIYSDYLYIATSNGVSLVSDFMGVDNYNSNWMLDDISMSGRGRTVFMTNEGDFIKSVWLVDNQEGGVNTVLLREQFESYLNVYITNNAIFFTDNNFPAHKLSDGSDTLVTINGSLYEPIILKEIDAGLVVVSKNSSDLEHGSELYILPNEHDTLRLLADLIPGPVSSNPYVAWVKDSFLYVSGIDLEIGDVFYRIHQRTNESGIAADFFTGNSGSDLTQLATAGGRLFYQEDFDLWVTNGFDDPLTALPVRGYEMTVAGNVGSDVLVRDAGSLNSKFLIIRNNNAVDTVIWPSSYEEVTTIYSDVVNWENNFYAIRMEGDWNASSFNVELVRINVDNHTVTVLSQVTAPDRYRNNNLNLNILQDRLYYPWFSTEAGWEMWEYDLQSSAENILVNQTPGTESSDFGNGFNHSNRLFGWTTLTETDEMNLHFISAEDYEVVGNVLTAPSRFLHPIPMQEINNSTLFIFDKKVYQFDTQTGELLELYAAGEDQTGAIDLVLGQSGVVYFVATDQTRSIWITDGTTEGTEHLTDLDGYLCGSCQQKIIHYYSDYVLVQTQGGIEILNIATSELVAVDELILSTYFQTGMIRLENNFYIIATRDQFGKELHRITLSNSTRNVTGKVYEDNNNNGQYDEEDHSVTNVAIELFNVQGDSEITFTNENGEYSFYPARFSDYTISILPTECWILSSDSLTYQVMLLGNADSASYDFGLSPVVGNQSLRTQLTSSQIRCGFTIPFWLTVTNDGCQPLPAEVSLDLGEEVTFVSADLPAIEDGTLLLWSLDTLQVGEVKNIRLELIMPGEDFNDQEIPLTVIAENEMTTDTFYYNDVLSCAIDPNDKQVIPSRPEASNSNYTRFDETLIYNIRFQNTGTDTAFTVRIEDQLSSDLDPATFRPLTASHPYRASMDETGLVQFLFEDIMLPDSNVNESLSHGFVSFEIDFKVAISEGTAVENTAAIYFDFNRPVITNTVTSTAVEFLDQDQDGYFFWNECDDENELINPDAEDLTVNGIDENCDDVDGVVSVREILGGTTRIFPNPTNGRVNITFSDARNLRYDLYDLRGVLLLNGNFNGQANLDLSKYTAGVYLIRIMDPVSGLFMVRKVERF